MRYDDASEIRSDSIYPLSEFKRRAGLETAALRRARREGLIVRRCGRRHYVNGADFHEWLKENGETVG